MLESEGDETSMAAAALSRTPEGGLLGAGDCSDRGGGYAGETGGEGIVEMARPLSGMELGERWLGIGVVRRLLTR